MDLTLHAIKERDHVLMMRTMTLVRQCVAAAFFIMIGLIAYGCGDSATINPVVELASLEVDPGTIQPGFSGGTTQYNVDLSGNVTSVTVTALPAVEGDTVTINGQATTSSVIALGEVGTTTPVNIVVSESSTSSRTYIVLLNRGAGNNSLENLTVSPGTLDPAFDMNTLRYTADVANTAGSVRITPTLSDPTATMTVNGNPAISGQASTVSLNGPGQSTVIPIAVTAQNGGVKTYEVTVSRGVSTNNNLSRLAVSPGPLTPAFSASRRSTSYTVSVGSGVDDVTVSATPADSSASLTINGQGTRSRSIDLGPPGSSRAIIIVVTAQNGTQKTYTVDARRAALSGNNNLSRLTVSPSGLSSTFSASRTSYTVNVDSDVERVTVTATKADSDASMTVEGQGTGSGVARSIGLGAPGSRTDIDIRVIAPNGSAKTYTVEVRRDDISGNNNLSRLTVSPGGLSSTFSASRTSYTVNVNSDVGSVTVTATKADSDASMTVEGQGTGSGQARSINLGPPDSRTDIDITVIAPNGSSKTYEVEVRRAALTAPDPPDLISADDTCPLDIPDRPTECVGGTSREDNITDVTRPRFRIPEPGAGEPPKLRVDGGAVAAEWDGGADTLQPTEALDDGEHTITYTMTNAGVTSPPSRPLTVEINTVVQPPGGGP